VEKRLRLMAKRGSVRADVLDNSERIRVPPQRPLNLVGADALVRACGTDCALSARPGPWRWPAAARPPPPSLGLAGYQEPTHPPVTTIAPGGCVPAPSDDSVNVISQTSELDAFARRVLRSALEQLRVRQPYAS
jgi:hypothetical protein